MVGERVAVMAMVKAAGYGHGAALAAAAALDGGATWLGVSSAEEALQLRAEGFSAPLLVVGAAHPAHLDALVAAGVQITVWDPEQVAAVAAAAGQACRRGSTSRSTVAWAGSEPRRRRCPP